MRSSLIKGIDICIAACMTVYLLSYIHEVPDVGVEPCNPNLRLQRVLTFIVIFLLCQRGVVQNIEKKGLIILYLVCSVMLGLVWNEIIGKNQDWGFGQFFGFVVALLFPFVEKKLMTIIDLKK